MMLHCPLLPLSVQLHRPFHYLYHTMSTTTSRQCRCLTTHTPLVRPLTASAFPLPRQIQPLLVQCETQFSKNRKTKNKSESLSPRPPNPLLKLPQSTILPPLPSHPL